MKIIELFKPKEKEQTSSSMEYVFVSTPQHSPHKNEGWEYNNAKGCYEQYLLQGGLIDKSTWIFYSLEKGGHDIYFRDKDSFNQFRVLNTSI